jgi:hypothetical protein
LIPPSKTGKKYGYPIHNPQQSSNSSSKLSSDKTNDKALDPKNPHTSSDASLITSWHRNNKFISIPKTFSETGGDSDLLDDDLRLYFQNAKFEQEQLRLQQEQDNQYDDNDDL